MADNDNPTIARHDKPASERSGKPSEFEEFCSGEKDLLLDVVNKDENASFAKSVGFNAPRLENTYQLEPERMFPSCLGNRLIKEVLESKLTEEKYDAKKSPSLACEISDVIRAKIKELNVPRYKIAVLVHLGQKYDQGMVIGSRSLWTSKHDTFCSASYTNRSLYAVGTVYACYYE